MASLGSIARWDLEVDVAIAGCGLAGCIAAVEAVEQCSATRVVIFEKAPREKAGGNSRVSGQTLWIAQPPQLESVIAYQRRLNATNPISERSLRRWAEQLVGLEPWIRAKADLVHGASAEGRGFVKTRTIAEFPELGANDAVAYNATIEPNPSGVWRTFHEHLQRHSEIAVHYDSPLVDLVQDPDGGEVYGLIANSSGARIAVRARGGVILACGSFEAAESMHRDLWGAERMVTVGSPFNTGDALPILQRAGARLWHLRNFVQSAGNWPAIMAPGFEAAFLRRIVMPAGAWFDIGANDCRFYDEAYPHNLTHYHQREHGRWTDVPLWRALPVHMIFDGGILSGGPLVSSEISWNTVVEGYRWSANNRAELERGWITRADSIEALARQLSRSASNLTEAIERFNRCARGEEHCPFGRTRGSMSAFEAPPYYAVTILPGLVCSTGGAERNERSQVLDHSGTPIPGLYEAGELGTIFSGLYQNGAFLTEAMISGRTAGREAAIRAAQR